MARLETNQYMSPLQLGIAIVEISMGSEMMVILNPLVSEADHATWISLLLGGFIFGIIAFLIVKLGEQFPEDTLIEYMPKLWGRSGSHCIIWWLAILLILIFSITLISFAQIITFFFFDRTPIEVIALGMLIICIYTALQDFGTILRILQLLFFTITPLLFLVTLLNLFNFQMENLLPIWPENWSKVISTSIKAWPAFSGYEFIMLLLPLVSPGKIKITSAVNLAMGYLTFIFTLMTVLAIGVLTAEGIKAAPYPILSVVRGIQIPGTFIERLEGYFLLLWIPIAFDSLFMLLWGIAQILTRHKCYKDHRPWVLLIAPVVYAMAVLLDSLGTINIAQNIKLWMGVGFSLVIVPFSLILAWRKRGGTCCNNNASNG